MKPTLGDLFKKITFLGISLFLDGWVIHFFFFHKKKDSYESCRGNRQ